MNTIDLKKLFLLLAVVTLFSGGITSMPVFADENDEEENEEDDNKGKKEKTLESECAKKKPTNFDGLFCQALFGIQSQIDALVVDITINWIDIIGIPADIADGDDDTQLTEAEVDAFVANNGFSTGPHTVDTDTTYSGADFVTSGQECIPGSVVTGIDANGLVTCATDQTGSGTSLSCENQIAIVTVIPEFSVDLTCLTIFSINGVIRDSETNIPIPLVSIEFGPLSGPPVTSTGGNDGNYSFANLTPDTYLLTFSKDGYQSTSHSISVTGHHTLDVSLVPTSSIDFTGVYSISPTVSYQCALGQVDFAFSGINVVHDTNTDDITIDSLGGSAPALSGSAIDDSFSATGVVGGTCTETYQITAGSIDENNVNGVLSATYAGSCLDCFNQNFFFTGTK